MVPHDEVVRAAVVIEDSTERFLTAWSRGETRYPYIPCHTADLLRAYLDWCRQHDEEALDHDRFHRRSTCFKNLKKMIVTIHGKSMRMVNSRDFVKPPYELKMDWYARSMAEFRSSLL